MGEFSTRVGYVALCVGLGCASAAGAPAPNDRLHVAGKGELCPENVRVDWSPPAGWTEIGETVLREPVYDTPFGQQTLCSWSKKLWEDQGRAIRRHWPIPWYPTGIPLRDERLAGLIRDQDDLDTREAAERAGAAEAALLEDARQAATAAREQERISAIEQRKAFARSHIAEVGDMRLCMLAEDDADLRTMMKDERRAAQISGAVDLRHLNELGYDIAQNERKRAHAIARVRELAGRAPRCDAAAKAALQCSRDTASCADAGQRALGDALLDGLDIIGRP